MHSKFLRHQLAHLSRIVMLTLVVVHAHQVTAQTRQVERTEDRVKEQQSRASDAAKSTTTLNQNDLVQAQIWGLTPEEMQRAKLLLQGPRASFSVTNLSPIEALGIHARNDAERRKYAEMFARAFHQDVDRSLAWDQAFQQAMQSTYPNEPIIDYRGQAAVEAPVGTADMLNVPRTLIVDPARSAKPGAQRTNAHR
jgi:hypothetical protein